MSLNIDSFETLRAITDDQKRGYLFEQIVREALPWSFRPPLAISMSSEQIDAFFEFNGHHFLVEAKAKIGAITPGSHDWEDFELKVRRRGGSCIGLFCSLYPTSDAIHDAATNLNRSHHTTIILSGMQWDEAVAEGLAFGDLLRFMVSEARSRHNTRIPSIAEIRNRLFDVAALEQRARGILQTGSATFLRRHRSPRHEQIYVPRTLDGEIAELAASLEPSRLKERTRNVKRAGVDISRRRMPPPQIAVVRDLSGAGKTTLSVQLTEVGGRFLCQSRAALEPSIDGLGNYLEEIGPNSGLFQLLQINKPVVYVVDSLDEGLAVPHKTTELRALFRFLDDLNGAAQSRGFLCFPLLIVLTIREEYWREWESQLEGRGARILAKRVSRFTPDELQRALKQYQAAYRFLLVGTPRQDLLDALAHPFTLQVYAEANEYAGQVDVSQHMGFRVLSLFFERKKEDVLKRPIPGFTGDTMMRISAAAAADMVRRAESEITETDLGRVVRESEPLIATQWAEVVRALRSEQIFAASETSPGMLRFRHSRFLEYLLAFHIERQLTSGINAAFISELHEQIAATTFASPYIVLDYLKALTADSPENAKRVQEIFTGSVQFMTSFLRHARAGVAGGAVLDSDQAKTVRLAIANRDPALCWEGFFVLAAANSRQPAKAVLEAFCLAWDANSDRDDAWRIIPKLVKHKLLFSEEVIRRVIDRHDARTWLVYIDAAVEAGVDDFAGFWAEAGGAKVEERLIQEEDTGWALVLRLLSHLKRNEPYPRGEFDGYS